MVQALTAGTTSSASRLDDATTTCSLAIPLARLQRPPAALQSRLHACNDHLQPCSPACTLATTTCSLAVPLACLQRPPAALQSRLHACNDHLQPCSPACMLATTTCSLAVPFCMLAT